MSEQSLPPDSWIGERVALRFWTGSGQNTITCGLEAITERGVVVVVEADGGEKARFYPWSTVVHIQPASAEAEDEPHAGPLPYPPPVVDSSP